MELTHGFTVPGTVEETWERFGDIADLAECFPGAQVTSVSGDSFEGTVKVKLGPVALVYAGSGSFVSRDEAAHRFVVEAKGRDKRGNGTAAATVTVSMTADGAADATAVSVQTDLSITGKPAQFGRGMMQDVSDKLLGQFVACLEQRSTGEPAGSGAPATESDPSTVAETPPPQPSGASATGSVAETVAETPPGRPVDAIDLGATVLPVLVRSYWKQAAAAVALGAVIAWLVRRLTS